MSLNPVTAAKEIFDRYCSYITTTFRLNSENLNKQIERSLREPGKFAKGPILQIIPPFLTGKSVTELIASNELNPDFQKMNTKELPPNRALFYHQEQAIKTICKMGKSAVVATGTGSGKTECFLVPILNHLLDEKKQGTLNAGVRALLLYPMNALANDQIKRLRALLVNESKITFGIYTGETERKQKPALEKYLRMYGQEPLPNEIISRERMREGPPHILLTNYAMLEYLMLRPEDNVFFQGLFAKKWQFIVLDEAHTYTGARGIEMAMLLARLKNAISAKKGDLRFVLTSATLGRGQEDAKSVAKFASKLTGEDFTETQVITATHRREIIQSKPWGRPHPVLYQKLQRWLETIPPQEKNVVETLGQMGVPEPQIQEFQDLAKDDLSYALFCLLQGDQRVADIISLMEAGPADLYSLAQKLFGNHQEALTYATSFIDLCNRARPRPGNNALLPARYHFFVKALEGAFIVFTPKTRISLERVKRITEEGCDYKAFELGACTRCHGLYLIGEITLNKENGYSYLEPVSNNYNMESTRNLEFFAISDKQNSLSVNEDDVLEGLGLNLPDFKHYRLCVYCGGIGHDCEDTVCICGKPCTIRVIKVNHKGRAVHKCGLCGSISSRIGVVRRFYLSEDAISSVLSTALYQQLPGRVPETKKGIRKSIFGSALETTLTLDNDKVKQLLIFSDSRQNAAFFAPYLSTTYNDLLAGNLLLRTLAEYQQECLNNKWNLVDFNRRVCQLVNKLGVLQESAETLEELVWKWIMREFTMQSGRFSLESMVAHEHTAQLATEYAAQVQTDFINGKINVLSCFTTFELGVDVGELETVYMKNVPPTAANYAQRAGRAGRRLDATAFALTFARLASHDFNQFNSPEKMISGVVQPPHFDVDNEKIARRHLYACAFAHFWRAYPAFFHKVANFFGQNGPNQLREHLEQRPTQLLQVLQEIFSPELQEKLGINNWAWVDEMNKKRGIMTKVVKEIMGDLLAIEDAIEKAAQEKNFGLAKRLQWIQKTIMARPLINYLAQKSLLPKYGFPVDVVNLDVNMHTNEGKNIDLSRDLQIAIGEYAPDSQVIANGRLWTGRYVKRVKGRELVRYHYVQCRCGYFGKVLDVEIEHAPVLQCPVCGQQANSSTFVVPEFGFIAEDRTKKPGAIRPERTYACRKFFSGEGDLLDRALVNIGKNKILVTTQTHGVLTVINNGLGGGFYLCRACGYGTCQHKPPEEHNNPYGSKCLGGFEKVSLGYNLETDITRIDCSQALETAIKSPGYWESVLYSLIEGMSEELEIDRNDLDGTIFVEKNGQNSLILFDTVPGGADHVKRILEKGVLEAVFHSSLNILKRCSCGGKQGDTSCYGCLRNYQNQFVHDQLRRDYGIDALQRILGKR